MARKDKKATEKVPFQIKLKKKDPYDFDCNLECEAIRLQHPVDPPALKYRELNGNVYFVIEPPHKCRKFCEDIWAGCLTIGNALMAIAVFAVLTFSATDYAAEVKDHRDKLHVPLCSLGLILFSGSGIMSINRIYGPSAQLSTWRRWLDHTLLTGVGFLIAFVGAIFCFVDIVKIKWTKHSIFGLVSLVLGFIGILTGSLLAVPWKKGIRILTKMLHLVFGLLTFLSHIGCFVTGLLKPQFIEWGLNNINRYHYIMIFVIGLYALIVIVGPCLKCKKYGKKFKKAQLKKKSLKSRCKPTEEQIDQYILEEELDKLYPHRHDKDYIKKNEDAKEKEREKEEAKSDTTESVKSEIDVTEKIERELTSSSLESIHTE